MLSDRVNIFLVLLLLAGQFHGVCGGRLLPRTKKSLAIGIIFVSNERPPHPSHPTPPCPCDVSEFRFCGPAAKQRGAGWTRINLWTG